MLKNLSHIILSLLLLVSTMGLAVSKQYCGSNLVSVSLFDEAEPCCDMPGCCHNETSFFQIKVDFSSPQTSTVPNLTEITVLNTNVLVDLFLLPVETDTIAHLYSHSPPPPPKIQTFLSLKQSYLL